MRQDEDYGNIKKQAREISKKNTVKEVKISHY